MTCNGTRSGSGNGRTVSAKAALLALVLGTGIGSVGCAGAGRADIDRSQPDKVDKSFFLNVDGTPKKFYYRLTITDVPPTNGWAFEGMQGPMDKIYFQITEDQLIGYRAYDYAPGSENPFTGGANNTDAPVVSFKIKAHFDVKREYNPGTASRPTSSARTPPTAPGPSASTCGSTGPPTSCRTRSWTSRCGRRSPAPTRSARPR